MSLIIKENVGGVWVVKMAIKLDCGNPVGDINPIIEYPPPSGSVNAQCNQNVIHVTGIKDGYSSSPASYVQLTASGGHTPNRFPSSNYHHETSYDINVPNWVKTRTGTSDVGVELYVRNINGTDVRVGTANIAKPWASCTPPTHHPPVTTSECSQLYVRDGGDAVINGKTFSSDAIRTTVRVYDDSGQVMVHAAGDQNQPVILNNAHPPPGAGDWNPPTGVGNWTYTPRNPTVHVIVYRQYWHNTGTKDSHGHWIYKWTTYHDDSRVHRDCYGVGNSSGACTVDPIDKCSRGRE